MLFNSLEFLLFLPAVFLLYWFVFNKNFRLQNILLLAASYVFYGYWDYRFLFLLMFSTFLDYFTGIKMHEAKNKVNKKLWLWLSISINVGFLGVFKYFNFFIDSFSDSLSLMGFKADFWTLQVILPVGISFYTFHGLSYVIDIYKDRIKPERNIIDYSVFVSFFPLLVAGPIERATHLLPQIIKKRKFEYVSAVDGMRQILWGFFKKIVIADNCSGYVTEIFNNYQNLPSSTLIVGAFYFAIQIYCDFSGYSDIAIGTARLFGINLLRNFAFPYFSRDIAEFWRRWHISLTTWFRDYLYIPLGGSMGGIEKKIKNTFIIFIVSGFWHGANWTFIVWGLLNALYFLPLILLNKNRINTNTVAEGKWFPSIKELFQMGITFFITVIGWIFFRAKSIEDAVLYIKNIFSRSIFEVPENTGLKMILPFVFLLIIVEWLQREKQHGLEIGFLKSVWIRRFIYVIIVYLIFVFGNFNKTEFIYFAF